MSLYASSVYVINDMADIDSDRKHPSKCYRPFASGELSLATGFLLAPALLALGFGLSYLLPSVARTVLLSYATVAVVYTFHLKKKLIADVVTLALLYTIRIVVGGAATGILVSPWLLAFSLFLFLSLAFSKRVTEMLRVAADNSATVAGRGYYAPDSAVLVSLGTASGYLACLVLSLYINSASVRTLYPHPGWLWLLLPLLLNWIGRNWVVTVRGRISEDPVKFLSRDFRTHVTLICAAALLLMAKSCSVGIPGIEE
jgi:4-hydroxybenzoate polyprenyltransferase